ncbi:hypothetical protein BCD49_11825 [Pseudofrankia sp. EUN1h]|nr:hypothetical protein BCD49_11825 [Pseudofrankia sp. EUN1h]
MVEQAVPVSRLAGWLRAQRLLPADADGGDLEVVQLAGGASNLTFRVRGAGLDLVLRRPPVSGALPTAHDVVREYRIQEALAPTGVPVARMVAACSDPEVIGAPFYLMGHLDGVIHASAAELAALPAETARRVGLSLADTLASVHAVRPERNRLRELARPESFLDRTLRRWRRQWGLSQDPARPLPGLDTLFDILERGRPPAAPRRLVHGDYNLANVMYAAGEPSRVLAVLDWELAALGDALADLGALLSYWGDAGRVLWAGRGGHLADANPAMPSATDLVERYALTSAALADTSAAADAAPSDSEDESTPTVEATLRHLPYYEVLATVKLAVIVAGAARRQRSPEPDQIDRLWRTVSSLTDVASARAADARLVG